MALLVALQDRQCICGDRACDHTGSPLSVEGFELDDGRCAKGLLKLPFLSDRLLSLLKSCSENLAIACDELHSDCLAWLAEGASLAVSTGNVASILDDDMEPETPTAAAVAVKNADGGVDLNIDISVLGTTSKDMLLAKALLGNQWQQALSPFAVPSDVSSKKLLSITDYKRRQGIA